METDPIYEAASQPALLHYDDEVAQFSTLPEAVLAFRKLPQHEKSSATIEISGGPTYSAEEIMRLRPG